MMNYTKQIKTYLLVALLLACVPTPHVMGMQKINAFFSTLKQKVTTLVQKVRRNQNNQVNNQNQNEQQPNNIQIQEIGNNTQAVTIDSLIKSIKTFIKEEPLVIDVKITQTEQFEKAFKELDAAENFKLALKQLNKQLELKEKIQINSENNNEENNTPNNAPIKIGENDKDELIIENNNNQLNNTITHLIKELEKMKQIENNRLTDEGYEFGKKLIEDNKNDLPLVFSDLVNALLTRTKERIKELKKVRKEFIKKALSKEGIQAQAVNNSIGKNLYRFIKISGKWCLVLSAGGFALWAVLNTINQIQYIEYLVPDDIFTLIGPFTIPKALWCLATFPIRFFGTWLDPQTRRNQETLTSIAEKCIESTQNISQQIANLNNFDQNGIIFAGSPLKDCVSSEFKKALGNSGPEQTYFKKLFSKILAEKICTNHENLRKLAFEPAPSHEVLTETLNEFNTVKTNAWTSWVSSTWNTMAQRRWSDYISW